MGDPQPIDAGGEVCDVAGAPGHGFEFKDISPASAGEGSRALPGVEGVGSDPAAQVGAGRSGRQDLPTSARRRWRGRRRARRAPDKVGGGQAGRRDARQGRDAERPGTGRTHAVGIDHHAGSTRAVGLEPDIAITHRIGPVVAGVKAAHVELVSRYLEIRDPPGAPRHGPEGEDVGSAAAGQDVGALTGLQSIGATSADQARPGSR